MSWAERAPERVSGVSCVSTSRFPVWNSGPPPERGHLMVSSQGSEVTNGDEDPAIIRGRKREAVSLLTSSGRRLTPENPSASLSCDDQLNPPRSYPQSDE